MKSELSNTAFWDVDMNSLDENEHSAFIIVRVFQYGLLNDLKKILKFYSADQICDAFKTQRGIDEKAIALAKVLGYVEE